MRPNKGDIKNTLDVISDVFINTVNCNTWASDLEWFYETIRLTL